MVSFQFTVPDDVWNRWKETVPRDVSLADRLRFLIMADADDQVLEREPDIAGETVLNKQAKLSLGGRENGERPISYYVIFEDDEGGEGVA